MAACLCSSRREHALPILMYHGITQGNASPLEIPLSRLESHFEYLQEHGFTAIFISELLQEHAQKLPAKPVIITFDDAYASLPMMLFPLLKKHGMKACIALPMRYIGDCSRWDGDAALPLMSIDAIRNSPEHVEYLLHSYSHINYRHCSIAEAAQDIAQAMAAARGHGISIVPALAYPYGGYPRGRGDYAAFVDMLKAHGIRIGLRIGNRCNLLPLRDSYCVCRLDIRSDDALHAFARKVHGSRRQQR